MDTGRIKGFTLVELMIVLAVITIAMGTGTPSFTRLIQDNRQTSLGNQFLSAINFSRNSAITKRQFVTVCASSNSISCDTTSWQDGWIVFIDTDSDRVLDSEEEILRRQENFSTEHSLRRADVSSPTLALGSIQFLPSGFVTSTANFTLCDSRGASFARGINLNLSGQARVDKGVDPNGDDLECL